MGRVVMTSCLHGKSSNTHHKHETACGLLLVDEQCNPDHSLG